MFRRDYIVSFDKPLLKICLIWWHLRIQAVQFGRSAQTWPKFLPLPLAAGFVSGQEVIRKVGGSNFECTSGTIRYYNICTWEWRSFHYPHISTLSFLTWWYLISAVVAVHVFVRCLRFPGYMLLVGMEITDLQQHGALRFGSEFQVSPGPLSSGCVVVGLATTATRRFSWNFSKSACEGIKVVSAFSQGLFPRPDGVTTDPSTSTPRKCNYIRKHIAIFGFSYNLNLQTLRWLGWLHWNSVRQWVDRPLGLWIRPKDHSWRWQWCWRQTLQHCK